MAVTNNQQIMAALISCGSVRAAAKTVGISETTIRTRLNDPEFRQQYEAAKDEVLQEACDALCSRLTAAVDTLDEIASDDGYPASVRVSAAAELLRHALRYVEVCHIIRRIEILEEQQINTERTNQ